MTIKEQIEIVESNIAEYGVCDITIEEYKYLKQQIRADAERDFQNSDYWNDYLAKVISDARADAIDEYMNKLCDKCIQTPNECWNLECPFADDECQIIKIAEQLKDSK